MTDTVKKELGFLEWTKKVSEIINITHVCLIDKRKMKESDYETLKRLYYDVYWVGTLPLYKTVADMADNTALQADLFSEPTTTGNKKTANASAKSE